MNAWLATIVGDTAAPIVGFVLLFVLVIVLLLLVFGVLRRITGGTFVAGGRNRQVRLSVTDAAAVDNRRRLVLVRRDDVEHLILIGGPSDVVIEQNIRQFAKQPSRIEPAAANGAEPEAKPEPPRVQPAAAVAQRPAQPAQPLPQVPLRSPPPHQVTPPQDERPAEPPRQQTAPASLPPVTPMAPIPPVATPEPVRSPEPIASSAEAPAVSAPSRDTGNSWERTASPSFGTDVRAEPAVDTPAADEPVQRTPDSRATTAAAFPFSVRNEPGSSAYREPSLDIAEQEETAEPEITLGDVDFQNAFDTDIESELHVVPGKEETPKKPDNIEDEMERLLGDLARPEKR